MRVRKAIPEGYKTLCSEYCGEDKENVYTSSKSRVVEVGKGDGFGGAKRGLAPYCAILDVGGLGPQLSSEVTAEESASVGRGAVDDIIFQDEDFGLEGGELDDLTEIERAESVCMPAKRDRDRLNRKRGLELATEPEHTISGQDGLNRRILRPIAQPKSRKMNPIAGFATIKEEDEQMVDLKPEREEGDDFEEADFIRPMDYI